MTEMPPVPAHISQLWNKRISIPLQINTLLIQMESNLTTYGVPVTSSSETFCIAPMNLALPSDVINVAHYLFSVSYILICIGNMYTV